MLGILCRLVYVVNMAHGLGFRVNLSRVNGIRVEVTVPNYEVFDTVQGLKMVSGFGLINNVAPYGDCTIIIEAI